MHGYIDPRNRAMFLSPAKDASGNERELVLETDTGNFSAVLTTERWASSLGWPLSVPDAIYGADGSEIKSLITEVSVKWFDRWIPVEAQVINPGV